VDELINQVTQKTGISQDQARGAVQTVVGYLKGKLPPPVAGQLDNILGAQGGGQSSGGMIDQAKGMLGGLGGGQPNQP
jgi:hypothetical protein